MNVTDSAIIIAGNSESKRLSDTIMRSRNAESVKLKSAAVDFEALFIKQMLDNMRSTVQKSGFLDGGFAEEIYQDMLYDEYAKKMAQTARFGIAEQLYDSLSSYI